MDRIALAATATAIGACIARSLVPRGAGAMRADLHGEAAEAFAQTMRNERYHSLSTMVDTTDYGGNQLLKTIPVCGGSAKRTTASRSLHAQGIIAPCVST